MNGTPPLGAAESRVSEGKVGMEHGERLDLHERAIVPLDENAVLAFGFPGARLRIKASEQAFSGEIALTPSQITMLAAVPGEWGDLPGNISPLNRTLWALRDRGLVTIRSSETERRWQWKTT